jgi:hypothetical protein
MKFSRTLILASTALAITTAMLFSTRTSAIAIQGKWEVATLPDWRQPTDTTVPVWVFRVTTDSASKDESGNRKYRISQVIVDNRSNKAVSAIRLRWAITPMLDRTDILKRGTFDPHILATLDKKLAPGERQTLPIIAHPKVGDLVKSIPDADSRPGFAFLIGVAEVVFDDGSTWKEDWTEVTSKSTSQKQ